MLNIQKIVFNTLQGTDRALKAMYFLPQNKSESYPVLIKNLDPSLA